MNLQSLLISGLVHCLHVYNIKLLHCFTIIYHQRQYQITLITLLTYVLITSSFFQHVSKKQTRKQKHCHKSNAQPAGMPVYFPKLGYCYYTATGCTKKDRIMFRKFPKDRALK